MSPISTPKICKGPQLPQLEVLKLFEHMLSRQIRADSMCCDLAKGPASGGHNQGMGISDWENHAVGSTNMVNRKKFRSQTSDNVDRCSAEVGRVREEKRREDKRRSRGAMFCPMLCGSGRSKSRLAKTAGACGAIWGDERWKKCTLLRRQAHFQVKMLKAPEARSTFGSWDVQKVRAGVVRSTCRSEKQKKLAVSDHFWMFRCRKSAPGCGAKHICKSKVLKTDCLGSASYLWSLRHRLARYYWYNGI